MKIDHEYAIIELDKQEAEKFGADEEYRRGVIRKAEDLSDASQRTVEIYDHAGVVLETVSNY